MSHEQFHHELMAEQEQKQKLANDFDDQLYKNYHISNGDILVQLMEDMAVVDKFLKDAGLPADTEF